MQYMLICQQTCYFTYKLRVFVKIISIPDEKLFSETAVGAPLANLSKLYDVPFGFNPPFIGSSVLLYLQSPKGGCCLISDDLSCSCRKREKHS